MMNEEKELSTSNEVMNAKVMPADRAVADDAAVLNDWRDDCSVSCISRTFNTFAILLTAHAHKRMHARRVIGFISFKPT